MCVPFLQLAHSFKSWLNVSRLHVATERVPLTPLRSPRSSGLLLHTLSSSPRIGREQMTSLSGNPETGCYLWGWICSDRFAGTSKMVACTRVFGIPALTMAFTTAQCLSPAPSFCFPKGVGLSASSTTSLPACKWCTLGFLGVLTPCSPIPNEGSKYFAPAVPEGELKERGWEYLFSKRVYSTGSFR